MLSFKVGEQYRQGWGGLAFIYGGSLICVPLLLIGSMIAGGLSLAGVAFCAVIGFLILFVYGCLVGIQSSDTGLPPAVLSAESMGVLGARFVTGLLLSITSVGWFGVQSAACGASFSVMAVDILGISIPAWASTVFWGGAMTITAMLGFQALKFLNYIMVPVLLLMLGYTVLSVLSGNGISLTALLAYRPAASISPTLGISLTVGCFAMGGLITGDYCRYIRTRRGLILSFFISMVIIGPVVILSGAVFHIAAGNADMTALLAGMGLPAMALITLILSTWTTNVMNAYSGSIAVSVLLGLEERRFKVTAAITGSVGTILGAAGSLTRFLDFLSILSSLVPPLAGVIIAAYVVRIIRNKRSENSGGRLASLVDKTV
ncbi:MAG: cytosine permease, partial [Treponema sp.]|nr:cytosine permease [Treponema sp.]